MAAETFSALLPINQGVEDFAKGTTSNIASDGTSALINFITTVNRVLAHQLMVLDLKGGVAIPRGTVVDTRFPKSGTIESVPLFVNADTFPPVALADLLLAVLNNQTVELEFRTAQREDMGDAGEWQSISQLGASVTRVPFSGFSGPFVTDSEALSITDLGDGAYRIVCTGVDAQNEAIYFTSPEISSSSSTVQAQNLVAEFTADRPGNYLEWHVDHGLSFSNLAIGNSPEPFKELIGLTGNGLTEQIYFGLGGWPTGQRNFDFMRILALKVIDASKPFEITLRDIRLAALDDSTVPPSGTITLPVPARRFIQYRVTLNTTEIPETPEVQAVQFDVQSKPAIVPNKMLRHQKFFVNPISYPTREGLQIIFPDPTDTGPPPPPPPPVSTLNTDITFYYEMDEGMFSARVDDVGGNDLIEGGGTPVGTRASGAEFTGVGPPPPFETLDAGDAPGLSVAGPDAFVSFSCYLTVDLDTGMDQVFFNKLNGGDFEYIMKYSPGVNGGMGGFVLEFKSASGAVAYAHTFVPAFLTEYHVVFGHDPVLDEVWITIDDGASGALETFAYTMGTQDLPGPLVVGNSPLAGFMVPVDGVIRKLAKWDKRLTASEITELYNGGTPLSYPY